MLLSARNLMSKSLLTVPASSGLRDLVDFLRENQIHGALVAEGERLVGVISYSDVLTWLSDQAVDGEHNFSHLFASDSEIDLTADMAERLDSALVRDVMTPSVFTCDAAASAGEVAALLLERGIQRAVITEQGRAVGLVSARDLLRAVVDYERALARA